MSDGTAMPLPANERLAWGIIGTGNIARVFARGVLGSLTGRLVAVGSRTQEGADRFADAFGIPHRHASYDELLADPAVQAVYIAVPNHLHARWVVRAAEAGKHILCEKPLATNHAEAMVAIDAAREHDVFLMEAFMYRCHPQTARLVELIKSGAIGKVRLIQAHFSYDMKGPRENVRQQNPASGGGIMDVGCYTASMARLVAGAAIGEPFSDPIIARDGYRSRIELKAEGVINADNRVDEWSVAVVRFPGDIVATLTTGIQVKVDDALRVWGSEGYIIVPEPWKPSEPPSRGEGRILLYREGEEQPEEILVRAGGIPLYGIEADTVARHIADRQAPSPCMRWADTLGNMLTLDAWRQEIGLVFDSERPEALTLPTSGRPLARRPDHRMPYGQVAGIDKPVSRLVMGSMIFKPGTVPLARALLDRFVELGGTTIDTAHVYNCEETVGQWLKLSGVREQLVLIGKGMRNPGDGTETLTRQLLETLDKLQTDYVDLYLMHADDPAIPAGELVECLNEHLGAGRIHAFGGSNWSIARIEEANAYARTHGLVGFAASSPNLSLAAWNEPMWVGCISASEPASRAWYERTRMPLFAWSSQATGFFTGRFSPRDREQPALASIVRTWFNKANFVRLERVRELAASKGVTTAQIALAWVLQQPLDVYALIGPQTIDELNEALPALDVTLSAEELRWLNLETGTRPS
jgi:predicted dehydrogenase/aryl-alcohol dehydrogenase-like predicted oxidoreductase